MRQLPWKARVFVGAVIAAGVLLFLAALREVRFDQPLLFVGLLILSSAAAAMKVSLPLTTGGSTMSVSYAVDFASLLLLGPHETMFVAAGSALCQCHLNSKERNPFYRTLFSMASLVVTVQAAGYAFNALGGTDTASSLATLARPLVAAATLYFLLNTGFVATAIALSSRQRIVTTWHNNFLWSAPSYFVGAGTAAVAAWFIVHAGYWLPFTFAPLYLTYRTYKVYMGRIEDEQRHVQQTSDLHLATIEALARAIDAKDQTTQMHIRRVQVYAAGLARAAGLSEPEIQGVKTAALLHDIGKLAVPEHILSKPGPLTQEEFQKIRIHPQVGAEIIAAVPFPYPVAPIILSHHERWDGKGYPQGLVGDAIPIGARILTIVDYYDAVTTERPYHKALSQESAIGLLRHEAGRALDPTLVPKFVEMLPALVAELGPEAMGEAADEPATVGAGSTAVGLVPSGASAFENIALAHREIYALYEIAQSMGTSLGVSDTMALISSKISKIVPWSGCALFLYQPDSDTLRCRFAAGVDTPRLLNTMVKNGTGLSGWVARNRRTLVNADPAVTFANANVEGTSALRSAIVCPLHYNDTLIGSLALYHVDANYYTEDHRRLLERIAEQAGAVIHNSIVFEQTQEDSLTDPLTGLPNRRSMFVHLSRELARAERVKREMALIVMDVDGFKQINDTYGHTVGDHALRSVADALQGALRPYDLCVRYAGDEFIVVLSDCSREAADAKRRELQARVADVQLEVRSGKRIRLAASAGASVFPHDGTNYEALLADADHRMYRDKATRRGHLRVTQPASPGEFVGVADEAPALLEQKLA
ncbi:MAG TPA: diguanylate cyclase [Vicinamibacterales bacterium]|nr:diguanylate cyclase [Vicinamibacterales bacterium]